MGDLKIISFTIHVCGDFDLGVAFISFLSIVVSEILVDYRSDNLETFREFF